MYVAVKGGEKAIDNAHRLLAHGRRGDINHPELTCEQVAGQLGLAVDRVMTEGGIYDPELAALAIKQASGDLVEAIFLLRAYRTTLPRLADSLPLTTGNMRLERRISAVYKDLPGGQVLGPTYDYTHRLLDFTLLANGETPSAPGQKTRYRKIAHRCLLNWKVKGWRSANQTPMKNRSTLPARHRFFLRPAVPACNSWSVAMRVFSLRWATPLNVGMAVITPLPVKFARGMSR